MISDMLSWSKFNLAHFSWAQYLHFTLLQPIQESWRFPFFFTNSFSAFDSEIIPHSQHFLVNYFFSIICLTGLWLFTGTLLTGAVAIFCLFSFLGVWLLLELTGMILWTGGEVMFCYFIFFGVWTLVELADLNVYSEQIASSPTCVFTFLLTTFLL